MLKNVELAPFTSWRIGGVAQQYFRPDNINNLANFLRQLPTTEKITWLGLGSNVLIDDAGINGTVIHTHKTLGQLEQLDATTVRAEAGVTCAKLARFCADAGLQGAEFFAGIPGTVGGALAMNAGAFGGETWENILQVEVINRAGNIYTKNNSDYTIGYREVLGLVDEWFVAGTFKFTQASAAELLHAKAKIKEVLRKRRDSQPIGQLSCGSVFKNPPNKHAAKLIESAKLKNFSVGDATISTKHSNFIINRGMATAADVMRLINVIRDTVWRQHHIQLELEVKLLCSEK